MLLTYFRKVKASVDIPVDECTRHTAEDCLNLNFSSLISLRPMYVLVLPGNISVVTN